MWYTTHVPKERKVCIMRYDVTFNGCLRCWMVWRVAMNGSATVVRTFKTEAAARSWVAKQ